MLMTVMRALFRTEAGRTDTTTHSSAIGEGSAAAIMQRLHTVLCEDQSGGYFATMFVGVLDLRTGVLDYCNAGHERPIVSGKTADYSGAAGETAGREGADRGGADNTGTAFLDTERNLAVGALPEWQYEGGTTTLHVGEMLFLYTDGLNEARNADDEPLSRGRVLSLARQYNGETPQHFVELMEQAAHDHAVGISQDGNAGQDDGVEQSDDITLMAIRWLGNNRLVLQTDGQDLSLLEGFVAQVATRAHLTDEEEMLRLRLAVEEAVTNVISYAHAMHIELDSEVRDGVLSITLSDDGSPFDPTTAPMADTRVPADQRPEGGLGILFIRRMSDALDYERRDGKNVLTIKKRVNTTTKNI
jgi:sigma-B regulation protein RsbU (phosphoserine phosphatase)